MSTTRTIMHLDMDAFFVCVERLRQPRLRRVPLIIGGIGARGVVASCSYEARHYGVRSAMPMRFARRLCPEAKVITGDREAYSDFSHVITEIIGQRAPSFEKASIDEFYIDLSGMDKYIGCHLWAAELRDHIVKETHLPLSFGVACNKLVSKVGTSEAKPDGHKFVKFGEEAAFFAPLIVSKIPMVGEKTSHHLTSMGVKTIGVLQQIPLTWLVRELGSKRGASLHKKAAGIDHSPVRPNDRQKSISTEETFQRDTTDIHFLRTRIIKMTEQLCQKLRSHEQITACVSVKIRYSDYSTVSMQKRTAYTAASRRLVQLATELFDRLYQKRLLIRLIGVKFDNLTPNPGFMFLCEKQQKEDQLDSAVATINGRHGTGTVRRAASID